MSKAVYVSEATGWSGGCARLIELACGLRAKGWRLWIACRPEGELADAVRKNGLEIFPLPLKQDYDVLSALRLARFVSREKITILHAHHPKAHAVCLLTKLFLSSFGSDGFTPRLFVSRRVSFALKKNPFSRWKYLSGLIDAHVAVAESVKDILTAYGVPPGKVHVIRSGVDTERFFPRPPDLALGRALGLPPDKKIIGKIANAADWKGQDVFLESAAILVERGLPAHFLLVGRDTDGGGISRLIRRLGLEKSVTAAGFHKDIPGVVSLLDVSVNAAVHGEGLSGALRESLAMGVPVVGSDTAGNRELVRDGETGILCPPGDALALANAVEKLLSDPKTAKELAERGRAEVAKNFSLRASIEKISELYLRTASSSGS